MLRKKFAWISGFYLLLLCGIFSGMELERLLYRSDILFPEAGKLAVLCALLLAAGFPAARRSRNDALLLTGGALLLTLRAVWTFDKLVLIPDLLFLGGTLGFLSRRRYFKYSGAFAGGFLLGAVLGIFQIPGCGYWLFFVPLLISGLLISDAARLGRWRLLLLGLCALQIVLMPPLKIDSAEKIRAVFDAAGSALPGSLLHPRETAEPLEVLLVLPQSSTLEYSPWRILPYVNARATALRGREKLSDDDGKYDIVSLEYLPDLPRVSRKELLAALEGRLKENGILLIPETCFAFSTLTKSVTLPGSEGRRVAAGRSIQPVPIPEMEKKLQRYLENTASKDLILRGVFSALYWDQPCRIVRKAEPKAPASAPGAAMLLTAGVLYVFFRLIAARREQGAAFLAAMENTASAFLILMWCFFLLGRQFVSLGTAPSCVLLAGAFLFPFCTLKKVPEKMFQLLACVLPFMLISLPQGIAGTAVVLIVSLLAAFASGTGCHRLFIHAGNNKYRIMFAMITALVTAGLIFHFTWQTPLYLLTAALLLRLSILLRL